MKPEAARLGVYKYPHESNVIFMAKFAVPGTVVILYLVGEQAHNERRAITKIGKNTRVRATGLVEPTSERVCVPENAAIYGAEHRGHTS